MANPNRPCPACGRRHRPGPCHRPVEIPALLHGTTAGYKRGCRCAPCTRENRDYQRRWRVAHKVVGALVALAGPMALALAGRPRHHQRGGQPTLGLIADLLGFQPEPWRAEAACADPTIPADIFWPQRGESVREAKAVCRTCPVTAECLDYALTTGAHHGIWGATTERERRRIRRERGLADEVAS